MKKINSKSDTYFTLLDIAKMRDRLNRLGERLQKIAQTLQDRKIVLSPSDRPFETFEVEDKND